MILPDVNILIYAYDEDSKYHKVASAWLTRTMETDQVFLSWHTITGFLRIVTNTRALSNPYPVNEAVKIVSEWLARDNVHLTFLDKNSWPLFSKTLVEGQATGNLVMDAHLATMALSCGATLATNDRDFSRFDG